MRIKIPIIIVTLLMMLAPVTAYSQDKGKEKEKNRDNSKDEELKKYKEKVNSLENQVKALSKTIKTIQNKMEESELEKLKREAITESSEKKEKINLKEVFKSGDRALQLLNPEISFTVDMLGKAYFKSWGYLTPMERSGFFLRSADLDLRSDLDPYSFFKATIGMDFDGVMLEEGYITYTNILKALSLTVGKFRQQFGVVNRWHMHGLDQVDFPLALRTILGEGGLNQTGLSLHWLMPKLIAHANELTIEVTNSSNEHLFAGEFFSIPAVLLYFNNYYDLTKDAYLEWGVTGMFGTNNPVGFENNRHQIVNEDYRFTYLAGANLTIKWKPLKERYRQFLWRTEYYFGYKETQNGIIRAMGGYSYAEFRFNMRWILGIRYDLTQPFEVNNNGKYIWAINPYITYWQSEFVMLRLTYQFQDGIQTLPFHAAFLQLVFSAGPHKHEKY